MSATVKIVDLHSHAALSEPPPVSKRVLGRGLGSLMERANAADLQPSEARAGDDRTNASPSASAAGPGLRQFVQVSVGRKVLSTEAMSETASSPSSPSSPSSMPTAPTKRFRPAPMSSRRAPALGLVPLGLLLADATIMGLAFALMKAPAPSMERLLLCSLALGVACAAGCLAVVSAREES